MFEKTFHRRSYGLPISPEALRPLAIDSLITEIVAPELMDVVKPQIRTYRRINAKLAHGAMAESGFGD